MAVSASATRSGGTIAISSAGAITIAAKGTSSNYILTSNGAADDLTIGLAGANDASLILTSSETGTDAL